MCALFRRTIMQKTAKIKRLNAIETTRTARRWFSHTLLAAPRKEVL